MRKEKFGITCPCALFIKTAPGPHEHEKSCINVSFPVRTVIRNMTRISRWMQKYNFCITQPGTLFMETALGPPEHGK
jgi:hypothetical protein